MHGSLATVLVGRLTSSQVSGQQVQEALCPLRRLQAAGQPRPGLEAAKPARAAEALQAMGLTMSDAIRLLLIRVADEQRLPFTVQVPNSETANAMKEAEEGKGQRFDSVAELFEDLGI